MITSTPSRQWDASADRAAGNRKLATLFAVVLGVPHRAGAPHPEVEGGHAPGSLADSFVVASAAANAAFRLVLGVVASVASARFSRA